MSVSFAGRMAKVHRSFVTEILGVTENPQIISFAGGIPNADLFPVREVAEAARKVLRESGQAALQYSTTQGFPPLREWIAQRYWTKHGMRVDPSEVLITNGSQQSFDLIGKLFLEPGDRVVMECPAYHGALQGFSLYEPTFVQVPLLEDGIDVEALDRTLAQAPAKLFYTVPTFQNPSGLTYSREKRVRVARLLAERGVLLVEDDPYSELRFEGEDLPPIKALLGQEGIILGTFSKTIAPGIRLGWSVAPREITEKLVVAKQAADFHADMLAQRTIYQYLADNDLDAHIQLLREGYRKQRDFFLAAIVRHIPAEVRYTRPEGGMFVFMTLPHGLSSMELFEIAVQENVAFVPGRAFQTEGCGDDSLRLSFSSSTEEQMEEGMRRLGQAIRRLMSAK